MGRGDFPVFEKRAGEFFHDVALEAARGVEGGGLEPDPPGHPR